MIRHIESRYWDTEALRSFSVFEKQVAVFVLSNIEINKVQTGEFDPGSERTLAARLTHASRTPFFGKEWRTGE